MLKLKQNMKLTAGTGRLFLLSFLRTQKENKEKGGITRKCQKLHEFEEHVTLQ